MFSHRNIFVAFLITVNYLICDCESARILAVFPIPSISHQVVFRPLTLELAKRGHELTILTTDPIYPKGKAPANFTEIDLHDVYKKWREAFVENIKGSPVDALDNLKVAMEAMVDIFEMEINNEGVKDLLNSKKSCDLLLLEAGQRPGLIFSHIFKAPVIQISSLMGFPPNHQVMGSPSHPIYYPELIRKRLYNLSIWEKICSIVEDIRLRYMVWKHEDIENAMIRRNLGDEMPALSDLSNNVDMLFLNVNPIWDHNRPVSPSVVYLGGLHQNQPKELPTDLKAYLDSSKHGVIYMSFGTNVNPSQLPTERIQIFCKVFSKLPFDVLWKWNDDELPGRPPNVKISKWLPQSDLLRHPKIKLFITQAGLQSTDEAITAGVPLIAFPMLVDQWYNAEKYVYHNIGMKLELADIDEAILERSIRTVIEDASFRRNTKRLNSTMRDQPQTSLERAVWWTEYILRNGGAKHLRAAGANVSWTEFLMLDVAGVLLASICALLAVTYAVLCLVARKVGRISRVKVKKN